MRKERRDIAIIVLIFSTLLSWIPKKSFSQTSNVSYKVPLADSFIMNQNKWAAVIVVYPTNCSF